MKEDNLRITFEVFSPRFSYESDFNSLVLRLHELRRKQEDIKYKKCQHEPIKDDFIKDNNRNIEEMKQLLDNFIITKE